MSGPQSAVDGLSVSTAIHPADAFIRLSVAPGNTLRSSATKQSWTNEPFAKKLDCKPICRCLSVRCERKKEPRSVGRMAVPKSKDIYKCFAIDIVP
jgi:hypothetical protein